MRSLKPLCLSLVLSMTSLAHAEDAPMDAYALASLVADRAANEGRVGTMHFQLTSSSNRVREREALMLHSDIGVTERIAIYFTEPTVIEETAFLSFNHSAREDENWLYLPATERVRRLPAGDRGDYFLGTDLTYGDIKDNFKFALDDWQFELGEPAPFNGQVVPVLKGTARTPDIGIEMGYASFSAKIDETSGFPIWIEYTDTDGEPLKRIEILTIEPVGDAPTAIHFTAENLQTGHHTEVRFSDMRYVPDLDDSVFDPEVLAYGVPDVD
ncbi:MAG: outer membrane lipoprotein-sorting protein [Pseudomonadota bacterium]